MPLKELIIALSDQVIARHGGTDLLCEVVIPHWSRWRQEAHFQMASSVGRLFVLFILEGIFKLQLLTSAIWTSSQLAGYSFCWSVMVQFCYSPRHLQC